VEGLVNQVYHFVPQGTLSWQPIKVAKSAFFADQSSLSLYHSESDCNIASPISKDLMARIFLCSVYNFGKIWSSNPIVNTVNNYNFGGNTAKIVISRQISWNILDQGQGRTSWDLPTMHLDHVKISVKNATHNEFIFCSIKRWDNKSTFGSIFPQQHVCPKLLKSVDVRYIFDLDSAKSLSKNLPLSDSLTRKFGFSSSPNKS